MIQKQIFICFLLQPLIFEKYRVISPVCFQTKGRPAMREIEKSYLIWVGARHYSTIEDFVTEAVTMGVSKRTVNSGSAKALLEPGTVVFLAHDEGEKTECTECTGSIDCPDCRLAQNVVEKLHEVKRKARERGVKEKALSRIDKRLDKVFEAIRMCYRCHGTRTTISGTGGVVMFNDGSEMDYRQYMYWKRQPGKWNESYNGAVLNIEQCEECGGAGVRPLGVVFGMFVPSKIQYILKPGDDEEVRKSLEEKGFEIVYPEALAKELPRGCGRRKSGGFYVIADSKRDSVSESDLLKKTKELIDAGLLDNEKVEITGSFARFLSPVEIGERRFRGMKKWSLNPRVEEEAELILDALDD